MEGQRQLHGAGRTELTRVDGLVSKQQQIRKVRKGQECTWDQESFRGGLKEDYLLG